LPAVKRQINVKAKELNINPSGIITTLPIIAGFVRADAVADVAWFRAFEVTAKVEFRPWRFGYLGKPSRANLAYTQLWQLLVTR
jgi:hypothetical protein